MKGHEHVTTLAATIEAASSVGRPANAITLPLSGFTPEPLRASGRRRGCARDAEPAGEEEPADLRELSRARRFLPGLRQGRGGEDGCRHRCRRQFLLGRRRVRDHRPAGRDEHQGSDRLHAHDGRTRQGDAGRARSRIVAAVDGICAGAGAIIAMASDLRLAAPRARRSPSCSTRWVLPAATWAPAPSCPASSVRAAPPSCSTPAAS